MYHFQRGKGEQRNQQGQATYLLNKTDSSLAFCPCWLFIICIFLSSKTCSGSPEIIFFLSKAFMVVEKSTNCVYEFTM
uniref:Uncharacterized protein n=1 Tax=Anguilla anguilla TaxID=7936 RepID=A0A0E9WNV3_ANGAN